MSYVYIGCMRICRTCKHEYAEFRTTCNVCGTVNVKISNKLSKGIVRCNDTQYRNIVVARNAVSICVTK